MTNEEALEKLETATVLMCQVLDVLKGHQFTQLDSAIKTCYGVEDYLEQEIIKSSKVLQYRNNWESDEYYAGGAMLDNISVVEIAGMRYDVTRRIVGKSYSDHGHRYEANSWHYFIQEKVFGTVIEVDLNTLVNKTKVTLVE